MPIRESSVARDEDGEPSDHADDSNSDAVQSGGKGACRTDPVDEGCAVDDEDEGGNEGAQRGDQRPGQAPCEPALDVVTGHEADEGVHHNQWPRGGFPERKTRDHVLRGKPAIVIDGCVSNEWQDGVGAAEGYERGDCEETGELSD